MTYTRPEITHDDLDAANGLTVAADTVFDMTTVGQCVHLSVSNLGDADFTIKVNSSTKPILIPAGKSWSSGMMAISQFIIVTDASTYAYTGSVVLAS